MVSRYVKWVLLGFAALGLHAQSAIPPVERVLVPIYSGVDGRNGVNWRAELLVANPLNRAVVLGSISPFCNLPGCDLLMIGPRETQQFLGGLNYPNPGAMFVVEKEFAKSLTWFLRSYIPERLQMDYGVSVPVVLERDFLTQPIELPGVITDEGFRGNLRVYDPDATNNSSVLVSFVNQQTNSVIASTILDLRGGTDRSRGMEYYGDPSFGEILDFAAIYPAVRNAERVKIRIEPLTAGLRFWAFVTMVNNESQHATVVSP